MQGSVQNRTNFENYPNIGANSIQVLTNTALALSCCLQACLQITMKFSTHFSSSLVLPSHSPGVPEVKFSRL